ncbi:MAG: hypothetical protein GWN58_56695 [Anaerolineae bacterium]|nr:hypothetical protein [Anaerolineae bacterium]
MGDAYNDSKPRNAQAMAAWHRKHGPHSGARRPDVFDAINDYEEEQMEELKVRALPHAFVGDHVRIVDGGTHHMEQGRVVSRVNGQLGVVFHWDTAMAPKFYDPMHLEIINDR